MERRFLGAPKIRLVTKQGCHLDRVVVARHMRDEPITEPDDPAILHIEVGAVLAYSTFAMKLNACCVSVHDDVLQHRLRP